MAQDQSTENKKILTDALQQFEDIRFVERDQRDQGIDDIQFSQVEGCQWDDHARNARKDRPKYEVNKVALPAAQLVGDQRQSDIAIKVRPFGNGADQDLADTYQGLIRNIQNASRFRNARDIAFREMVLGGFGGWRIATEFTSDDTFDQDIKIKIIRSALTSIYFDSSAVDENKRDARHCFVVDEIPIEAFKEQFPNAIINSMSREEQTNTCAEGWIQDDTIRIAEYWVKVPVTKRIVQLSDGRVVDFATIEDIEDELKEKGVTITKEKTVEGTKVVFYLISGAEVLKGPLDWAGKFIPVVPLYGYNHWLSGKHYFRGMIRFAKDAQRIYNYLTSARVEAGALSPIDPYWMTEVQAAGHTAALSRMNVDNAPIQYYNPDPNDPGPPKRTGAPAFQAELFNQSQQADADIQATTGRFAPSLGDNPANQSGRALVAQQRQGDAGTFELLDSLSKAVEYTAEILVDLIPSIYDAERQIRIVQEDGETEIVMINETVLDDETGDTSVVKDLSLGKYDVVVDVGPSFITKRAETLDFLQGIMQSVPGISQFMLDLVMKNLDFPDAPELQKRMRRFQLQNGFVEPTEEEAKEIEANQPQQEGPTPEELTFAAQLDKSEAETDNTKADTAKTLAEVDKTRSETQENLTDVLKAKAEIAEMLGEAGFQFDPSEIEARIGNVFLLNQDLARQAQQQQAATQPQTQPQGPVNPGLPVA